ncbi:hypothetical protein BH09MYX1_BH09MYX1_45680 [soil metagenome]
MWMSPCACGRLVRGADPKCPFCGEMVAHVTPVPRRKRMARAAFIAAAASVVVGCSADEIAQNVPADAQEAAVDAADSSDAWSDPWGDAPHPEYGGVPWDGWIAPTDAPTDGDAAPNSDASVDGAPD